MKNIFTRCQSELQITVTYNLRGQENPPTETTHSDACWGNSYSLAADLNHAQQVTNCVQQKEKWNIIFWLVHSATKIDSGISVLVSSPRSFARFPQTTWPAKQ